jgi:IS1 family transposase
VAQWNCYFYVTDGWKVYPQFIPDGDQIVGKTYMTRAVRKLEVTSSLRRPPAFRRLRARILVSDII